MPVNNLIQLRRGDFSTWGSQDPILASGEPGYDLTNNILKIGDGITAWNSLQPINFNLSNYNIIGTGNINIIGNISAVTGTLDKLVFDTSLDDPALLSGQLAWNPTEGTVDLGFTDTYAQHLGEELHYRVRNNTASTLLKGTVVYASGLTPGGNNRIEIAPFTADGSTREVRFMGLVTENISNGVNGYTTQFGYIRGIDTRGDAASNGYTGKLWDADEPSWSEGDILYAHPTVAGKLTKVEPKHSISVAIILNRHQNQGKIFVRSTSYGHLSDNHDVNISGVSNGQFLQYNSVTDYWVPSSSGNFTSLQLNGTTVSVSGHSHTSSQITDFNSSVSGLLPVTNIVAGTGISISSSNGSFTINSTSTGGGGGGISNLIEDTTPQLGGNLDLNNYSISGVSFSTSPSGTSIGPNAWVYQSGQLARSEGKFDSDGDAQYSQYILRNNTTNNSWTPLKNNASNAILLASNRTFSFSANVVGRATNTQANAAYKLEGLLYNDGYGAAIVGTPVKTILGESDSTWDIRASISGGGSGLSDYLLVEVSGSNSYNINWIGKVDLLEVGGNITN